MTQSAPSSNQQSHDPIWKRVKTDKLTYLSNLKLRNFQRCLKEIDAKNIKGDFFEFGIALGGSAIILASQLGERRFHGYDVFGMIPPPGDDDEKDTHERYDVIATGAATGIRGDPYYGYDDKLYETVTDNFARYKLTVDGDKITLHKGLFEDTLRLKPDTQVALVHIDCDWYEPVLFCLETVAPNLANGGVIIVDDYNDFEGCRKATDHFLTQNPEFQIEMRRPHAVIKRNVSYLSKVRWYLYQKFHFTFTK